MSQFWKTLFIKDWQKEWNQWPEGRQSKYFLNGPDPKFKSTLLFGRESISQLIRSVTGHAFMKYHNMIVEYGSKDNPGDKTCRLCKEEDETPHHIITNCPVLTNYRGEIFYQRTLPVHLTNWSIDKILQFMNHPKVVGLETNIIDS